MKRFLLLAFLLLSSFANTLLAYQFDVIITKSRQQIQCIILSQNDNVVIYSSTDTQDLNQYSIAKSEIEKIYPRSNEPAPITDAAKDSNPTQARETTPNQSPVFDVIVLKDATRIQGIVRAVEESNIIYESNGKLATKPISDISVILFANGETKVFTIEQKREVAPAANVAQQSNPMPSAQRQYEAPETPPADREWAGGGRHTDKQGNTRTDFPGGHKTVHADGSQTISVPFVTIHKDAEGGRGVDAPQSDDIRGFQLIEFYNKVEDAVIIINKSSQSDCFKVAVCSVQNNQYFWRIVLTTTELEPYKAEIAKQKNRYRAKTDKDLKDILANKDRYLYSLAVKSRYGNEYSFKTYVDGDDLIIEVLDANSSQSDW